jgi:hypothetical protein
MVMTIGRPGDVRSAPRVRHDDDHSTFLSRWLRVWVILLTVVVLVVVGFLVLITSTLASINGSLGTADRAVSGAGGNTQTLPAQVDRINAALAGIDPALKPVPGQAVEIIGALSSINTRLTVTDASLKDTSSVLGDVLGRVNSIRDVLIDADNPADRLGVQNIHQRVAAVNGRTSPTQGAAAEGGTCASFCTSENLATAQADAGNILAGLVSVNGHLDSVCNSSVVSVIAGGNC